MHLKQEYRYEQIIKKSKFIACAKPIQNEEQARNYIEQIRKEYPDATHVCTAYVCGENNMIQRSSDNKEPAGTAGVPMLEAILNADIENVCVCVVRYFGGIKLGAGGLIRAYSSSTSGVLKEADKVITVPFQQYSITYPYDLSGTLENWLRRNTMIKDFLYDEEVTCLFETDKENIIQEIQNLTSGSITPTFIKEVLRDKEIE